MPRQIKIFAAGRSVYSDEEYRELIISKFKEYEGEQHYNKAHWAKFAKNVFYEKVDAGEIADFKKISARLNLSAKDELVCYLSTSPKLFGQICSNLNEVGLAQSNARVVLEKPIGDNLQTSQVINDAVAKIFPEESIFRIDHYLGKETVQNILALRFANAMFEPLWNNREIEHIQISLAETVGVEDRWSYYNGSGALRDMVQSHVLQLLALIAMEPPRHFEPDAVRNEKVKILNSLRPIQGEDVLRESVRGQYGSGSVNGQAVPGYLEADKADKKTETYVAVRAHIDNWRWAGVPFYLRSGKRMPSRSSEIYIQFKEVPYSIFSKANSSSLRPNKLVIRLQPEETIKLSVMNKVPGITQKGIEMREVDLNLSLSEEFKKESRRMAYQRLFLDIINNDTTLFLRRDEIEAAWRWADGILDAWVEYDPEIRQYSAGTWGPSAAYALTERHGHTWHDE